jgi:hypothetical protein
MLSEDEIFYQKVYDELSSRDLKNGLWLQSITEANGDETKAKIIYVKYRVSQIKEDERIRKIKDQESQKYSKTIDEFYTVICPKCHNFESIVIKNYKLPSTYKQFEMKYNSFIGKVNLKCVKCGNKFGVESQFIK